MVDLIKGALERGVQVKYANYKNDLYHHSGSFDIDQQKYPHFEFVCVDSFGRKVKLEKLCKATQGLAGCRSSGFMNSLHQKYMIVDNTYYMNNGLDISETREGNIMTGKTNDEGYIWYETSTIFEIEDHEKRFFKKFSEENFRKGGNAIMTHPQLQINNEYESVASLIASAKKYIYIENQYLISNEQTENKLVDLMIHQLIEHPDLTIVVSTNRFFEDTTNFLVNRALEVNNRRTQLYIYNQLTKYDISFERFRVYYLRKPMEDGSYIPIFNHSKFVCVDGKSLYVTTGNLCDRSLCPPNDREIGVLVEDKESISRFKSYFKSLYGVSISHLKHEEAMPDWFVRMYKLEELKHGDVLETLSHECKVWAESFVANNIFGEKFI